MNRLKIILVSIFCFQATNLICQVRLPRLISDGVVLQRRVELKLWGWAAPDETVELVFWGKKYTTRADNNGDWSLILPPQDAGGPFDMIFSADDTIIIRNVLFGDVWVCSGQSNMELTMERVKEKYPSVISESENNYIRQFIVPDKFDFKEAHNDLDGGSWESADPEKMLDFSAVAYFFARELYKKYHVPIGLINASLGGSPVEAWMSEEALKQFPSAYTELQIFKNDSLIAAIGASDRKRINRWYKDLNQRDHGLTENPRWNETAIDDLGWKNIKIPGYWADHMTNNINGAVWFRRKIKLPGSMAGRPGKLWLGRIIDQDSVFINGALVGTTGYQYPPRRYTIGSGILNEGANSIVIRVINSSGKGGFVPDKPYYLAVDQDTIDLKGTWKYKIGATMKPLESQTFIRWKPGGLYNRMIAPLLNISIKGVIWYQGESNTDNPDQYNETFPAMISDWRQKWDQGNFPFIYVQLANFMEKTDMPSESKWAELRQVQLNTLKVPNTGMAVTIDLGEWNDIHPLNKEDVGRRLALQAEKLAYYDTGIFAASPVPARAVFQRDRVLITFKNTGNGLITPDGNPLTYFSISGDGKNFMWAKAEIKGNRVVVQSKKVTNPNVVRYAWADNPNTANLYTKDGLPASPFEIRKDEITTLPWNQ